MYEYITSVIVTFVFLFGLFFYFVIIVAGNKHSKEASDFFDKEDNADRNFNPSVPKLNFIKPIYENIIILDDSVFTESKELLRAYKKQEILKDLISIPMIILDESSSTEIKIKYGANNFQMITEYEQNYYTFMNHLYEFALTLYKCNLKEESMKILEESIILKSENVNTYDLLAKIYSELKMFDDLSGLLDYTSINLKSDLLKSTVKSYM